MPPVRPWHVKTRPLGDPFDKSSAPRREADRSRLRALSFCADALALFVGLTLSFNVTLVGELPIAEVVTFFLLPLGFIICGKRLNKTGIKLIYALMFVWLANQIVADVYRQSAFADWTRGNATILFFAVNLAFMAMLLGGNEKRKLIYIVGYAVGTLLAARFAPDDLAADDPWKFGYATGFNILSVLAASYLYRKRRDLLCAVALLGMIGINLKENFRSPVLLLLIAVALTLPIIPERVGRLRLLPRAGTRARVAVLALMATAAAGTAIGLVRLATSSGVVDEDAQAKNKSQLQGGFIFAGRPEIVVSSRAVLDHPILGLGSWARDYKYVEMLSDFEAKYGLETDLTDLEESQQGLIPTHSHVMGAWVCAGIMGAVFWLYIFLLTCRALLKISLQRAPFALFYTYLLVIFLWDNLFSPFQGFRRATEAFLLVVIVDLLGPKDFTLGIFRRFSGSGWTRLPLHERRAVIQRHRRARSGNSSELQTN